ncbi:DUF6089 family protein [Foetidibacter luteolus]|uniref:DUF6089 family protein n=1 Tax=Foetidibacter luteolus TaxID=2608880 RepID=UPI00129A31D1|nr:DUF6089 family protein [Foetidibacter luteolus]
MEKHSYFTFYKLAFVFLIVIVSVGDARSQITEYSEDEFNPKYNREIGVQLGGSAFLGDLGGKLGIGKDFAKDYVRKTLRPLIGISYNYYPSAWYNIIGGINYTKLVGADSLIDNQNGAEKWRYNRNLSFKTDIWEAYLGTEILPLAAINQKKFAAARFQPYLGLGIGMFHFNPKTKYNDKWVDLKPLRLEGQGFAEYPNSKPYKLWQLYLPLTLGLKYSVSPSIALHGGIIFRYTFTDYIDDVGGFYVDPALFPKYLSAEQSQLAENLYSRSKTPWKVKPGIDRADIDGNKNDSYTTVFLSIRFLLKRETGYQLGYW